MATWLFQHVHLIGLKRGAIVTACASALFASAAARSVAAEPDRGDRPALPQAASAIVPESERPLGGSSMAAARGGASSGGEFGQSSGGWILNTGISLAGVVGIILAAAAIVRAAARNQTGLRASLGPGGRAPAGVLEVLGRYPVGRGTSLVLLKLDRRVLLLSQSTGGRLGSGAAFSTLCEITDPEEVASLLVRTRDAESESMSERFSSMLATFDRSMADAEDAVEGGRRRAGAAGGDRVELWDDRSGIPVVDLTRRPSIGFVGALASVQGRIGAMFGSVRGGARP